MENKPKDPLQDFAETISRDRELFNEQLKEVQEEYPLVALAYRIQQAVIAELSMPRFIEETEVGPLYVAFEPAQNHSIQEQIAKDRQRLHDFKICLMRAPASSGSSGEQYAAGLKCDF